MGCARLGAAVPLLVADREAACDADFFGAFRLLLGCDDPSFLFVAMIIPSSAAAASGPYRGARVLSENNDDVAVRFVRTCSPRRRILPPNCVSRFVISRRSASIGLRSSLPFLTACRGSDEQTLRWFQEEPVATNYSWD